MSYLDDLMMAALNGKKLPIRKCPFCEDTLKAYFWGYPDSDYAELMKKLPIKIGGCLCYGDERDAVAYCPSCRKDFNDQLLEFKIISCPLEAGGSILQHECRNYDLLESKTKYSLLEDRETICSLICPAIGRQVRVTTETGEAYEGELIRTFQYTAGMPGNHIMLQKNCDDGRDDFKDIFIKDIQSIEIID